jgi:hypothetical protein
VAGQVWWRTVENACGADVDQRVNAKSAPITTKESFVRPGKPLAVITEEFSRYVGSLSGMAEEEWDVEMVVISAQIDFMHYAATYCRSPAREILLKAFAAELRELVALIRNVCKRRDAVIYILAGLPLSMVSPTLQYDDPYATDALKRWNFGVAKELDKMLYVTDPRVRLITIDEIFENTNMDATVDLMRGCHLRDEGVTLIQSHLTHDYMSQYWVWDERFRGSPPRKADSTKGLGDYVLEFIYAGDLANKRREIRERLGGTWDSTAKHGVLTIDSQGILRMPPVPLSSAMSSVGSKGGAGKPKSQTPKATTTPPTQERIRSANPMPPKEPEKRNLTGARGEAKPEQPTGPETGATGSTTPNQTEIPGGSSASGMEVSTPKEGEEGGKKFEIPDLPPSTLPTAVSTPEKEGRGRGRGGRTQYRGSKLGTSESEGSTSGGRGGAVSSESSSSVVSKPSTTTQGTAQSGNGEGGGGETTGSVSGAESSTTDPLLTTAVSEEARTSTMDSPEDESGTEESDKEDAETKSE